MLFFLLLIIKPAQKKHIRVIVKQRIEKLEQEIIYLKEKPTPKLKLSGTAESIYIFINNSNVYIQGKKEIIEREFVYVQIDYEMEVNTEMVRHIIRTVHCYVLGTVISFAGDGDYRPAIREALELDHRNMVLIDWILNMPYGNVWRYRQNENTLKLYVITYSQWKEMKNLIRKYPEAEEAYNYGTL
ncbi:hypothetical protein RclHR1_01330019 [Rhizophagus clarus]|uniref:NYN domain-containing protein n=1 Tax=Rhizophagus clarus TaxID=94130 RepID=A0A2Z6QBI0_9GLOM|nr:hypothetical protein RclHR1_01330019 [Rhizophagus clarus]